MDRRWHLSWLAAPSLVLLTGVGLVIYAFSIKAAASAILREVFELRVGVSSMRQVEAVAARHKHWLQEKSCNGPKCFVAFEVYNTWLHRLKLEPIARFRADVEVYDGTVEVVGITLMRDTNVYPGSPSAGMTEEYRTIPKDLFRHVSSSYWFPTPVGKPYLRVGLTTEPSAMQRQHAYAYSLKCLVKPGGGCDLPCDYLPLAWHDWATELQRTGFAPNGFGGYYPTRARCP